MQINELFYNIDTKVEKAVERVRDAYKFSQSLGFGKLYVAFSGGKDSICLHKIVEFAAEKDNISFLDYAEVHYSLTTVDPPELIYFIRNEYPSVHINRPKKTMWNLIEENGFPPTSLMRYCCKELKEVGGLNRFCLTGIRWDESIKRKSRGAFEEIGNTKTEGKILFNDNDNDRRVMEHCLPKRKYVVNPIIDWKDYDIWNFIKKYNLKYCSLYDKGWKRIGCIGCPMATQRERIKQFQEYPKFKQSYIKTFDRMLKKRKEKEKKTKWKNGEDVFSWWLYKEKTFIKEKIDGFNDVNK